MQELPNLQKTFLDYFSQKHDIIKHETWSRETAHWWPHGQIPDTQGDKRPETKSKNNKIFVNINDYIACFKSHKSIPRKERR